MKRLVIALALVAAVGACKKSDQQSATPAADTSKAMMSDTGKAMSADTGKMMMGDTSKMTKAAPATTKKKP